MKKNNTNIKKNAKNGRWNLEKEIPALSTDEEAKCPTTEKVEQETRKYVIEEHDKLVNKD